MKAKQIVRALSAVALVGAGLAWRSGAPPGHAGAPSVAAVPSRRVILISLDGAGTDTLHELYRRGVLNQGGFARFFLEGEVADALIPVDPTLTPTNHVSLATGFPPSATGIVGHEFYPGGALSAETVSGFDATIGTETLWEAARRQGRQVGVLTWPGADARDARRTASWGLVFPTSAELEPEILTLARGDWTPAEPDQLSARRTVGKEQGGPAQTFDLFAVDSRNDGEARYDRVVVGAGELATAPLAVGQWARLAWPSPAGRTVSWIKLLALGPDLSEARLYVGGRHRTIAYPNGFAESLASHEIDWPGVPDNDNLMAGLQGKPGIDLATWTEQAVRLAAYTGETLRFAAARPDWDLLMCYVPVIDIAGHRLYLLDPRHPDFSPQRRDDFTRARNRVWQEVDSELGKLLARLDLTRTTVVVVSDHGMVGVHTAIDPQTPLAELAAQVSAIANGGSAFVYVESGKEPVARERLLGDLARRYREWRVNGEAPIEKVLTRREASRIGLGSPESGDLVVFARPGFVFRSLPSGQPSAPAPIYGAHGYLSSHPEMRAVYLAIGAGLAPARRSTVRATDVAPRVAAWLGIDPPRRSPS